MIYTNKDFFNDILEILPTDCYCYIQAPSMDNAIVNRLLSETEFDYYKKIQLNNVNKKMLISEEKNSPFVMYIQNIRIYENDKLIFEGFDGFEFGLFSKTFDIPEKFESIYKTEFYDVSNDW